MTAGQPPVVVGVDGSPDNDTAVRWAAAEAGTRRLPLRLVGVYRQQLYPASAPMGAGWPVELPEEIRKETQLALDRAAGVARAAWPEVDVETRVIEGDPVSDLLAESADAAVLVVGSRHRQTMGSVLLGSVGAGVAPLAHCPVVVIRGPAGEQAVGAWTVA